jgi:hypothetical protein
LLATAWRQRLGPMKKEMRCVICCDQGAPSELVRDALTVGRALIERGHQVAYIVGDPVGLVDHAGSWSPNDLYQAPVCRTVPGLVMKRPNMDGFSDVMATAGFDDKPTLVALSTLWHRQLTSLKPDAIIGLYTPILWLVGPAHAPTFALGGGLMLPPPLGTAFPRLTADSTPLADEAVMLANANAALLRLGQASMAALSEVLERCVSLLYGVPAFDPYLQIRRTVSTGLLGEEPSPVVPPAKPRLAAFLDVYCPGIETIILALAGFDQTPVDICVSGATASMRLFLEQQPHIKVWKDYATLLEHAASASALIHHGVHDVGQRSVSLGRPQLLIPWTREQEIFNGLVQWMSYSWVKRPNVAIDEMAGTFRAVLQDPSLVVAAQHHARQLYSTNLPDALPAIVEKIEGMGRK